MATRLRSMEPASATSSAAADALMPHPFFTPADVYGDYVLLIVNDGWADMRFWPR